MKVAIVSSHDGYGGAGRAAARLHHGLRDQGVDSELIVQWRSGDGLAVDVPDSQMLRVYDRASVTLDSVPLRVYRRRAGLFWLKWVPGSGMKRVIGRSPDLVNLHSFRPGFIRLESLRGFRLPLVWTMHDKWCLTGGCHFSGDCTRYEHSCGKCPVLGSDHSFDLSRWTWGRKKKIYPRCNLTFVAPSKWLAGCARRSSLLQDLRIEIIPYGIDLELFRPIDVAFARDTLGIPCDRFVVLFGAESATTDRRKGYQYVRPVLECLKSHFPDIKLTALVFGSKMPTEEKTLPFEFHFLGRLGDDESLRLAYSATDVFLCPSEEDNLPLTVMEAMACGTPTVSFRVGGLPDLIDHSETGYLADPFSVSDFARGISRILKRVGRMSHLSRAKAEREFSLDLQAHRYVSLFEDLVRDSGKHS